jgi:hypothetical protein
MTDDQKVIFTVPNLPPSINRLMRMHWAVRRRFRDDLIMEIMCAVKKIDVRTLKAWCQLGEKLSIAMHVTTPKEYDEDNLSSVAKMPLDILRNLRWLANDDPAHMRFEKPTQEKGKKAIRFTIRRLGDAANF